MGKDPNYEEFFDVRELTLANFFDFFRLHIALKAEIVECKDFIKPTLLIKAMEGKMETIKPVKKVRRSPASCGERPVKKVWRLGFALWLVE